MTSLDSLESGDGAQTARNMANAPECAVDAAEYSFDSGRIVPVIADQFHTKCLVHGRFSGSAVNESGKAATDRSASDERMKIFVGRGLVRSGCKDFATEPANGVSMLANIRPWISP